MNLWEFSNEFINHCVSFMIFFIRFLCHLRNFIQNFSLDIESTVFREKEFNAIVLFDLTGISRRYSTRSKFSIKLY